ncbi:MAG TPA: O-antigen ligase family protein [Anaerolineae bacterium]|nr:O-antigen ligase family protein [Anaerolineae bacterium]
MGQLKMISRWWTAHELWVLAVATPFFVFPGEWRVLVGIGLLGLSWLSRRWTTGRWSRPTPLGVPIIWLGVMSVVGYTVSVSAEVSWAKLWGMWGQIAFFWSVLNGLQTEADWRLVRWGYLLLPLAVAVVSFIGTDWSQVRLAYIPAIYDHLPQLSLGLPGSGVPRASELFHVRQVGATMALLLPGPLAWALWGTGWERWVAVVSTVVAVVVLLLSQALMGLLGLAVAIWLLLAWRWRGAVWLPVGGLLVLVGGIGVYGPSRLLAMMLDETHPLGLPIVLRLDMWSRAVAMVGDMPVTGVGLNSYPLIQTHFYIGYLLGPEPHAHNLWLQTAVDLGLPGLIAFIWLILGFLWSARRAYQQIELERDRIWVMAAVAGVVAYVAGGLLDTMTLGAKPMVAWWGLLALPTALAWLGQEEEPTGWGWGKRWFIVVPVVVMGGLWLLSAERQMAAWRGHQAVYAARMGEVDADLLAMAERYLAVDWGDNGDLWHLRGSVAGWQGDVAAARAAWTRQIEVDRERPLARYAPFQAWRAQLEGESVAEDEALTKIYTIWRTRYGQRADYYLLLALWAEEQGDGVGAAEVLAAGRAAEAQPAILVAD